LQFAQATTHSLTCAPTCKFGLCRRLSLAGLKVITERSPAPRLRFVFPTRFVFPKARRGEQKKEKSRAKKPQDGTDCLILKLHINKRPPSPSAHFDPGFYSDAHSFRKITVAFSRTADAQEVFGWCSRA
jgi:hypothetical protein